MESSRIKPDKSKLDKSKLEKLKLDKLKIDKISKFYSNKPVIRDISIELCSNEIVGILGPNGAGKTTCFSIIAGLIKPDSGKILINDIDITSIPIYKRAAYGISYLPQESSIFKGLTVADNIKAVIEVGREVPEDEIEIFLDNLLAEFSLSHLKYTPSIVISGGERRRLEIARCLALKPKFLLLDEPFAGIDPIVIEDIKQLIISLKQKNIGILITDHNVREALNILDRVYVIYDGQILIEGSVKEVISHPKVKQIYLGSSFD